jgi:hypothetical protein
MGRGRELAAAMGSLTGDLYKMLNEYDGSGWMPNQASPPGGHREEFAVLIEVAGELLAQMESSSSPPGYAHRAWLEFLQPRWWRQRGEFARLGIGGFSVEQDLTEFLAAAAQLTLRILRQPQELERITDPVSLSLQPGSGEVIASWLAEPLDLGQTNVSRIRQFAEVQRERLPDLFEWTMDGLLNSLRHLLSPPAA